MSRTKVTYKNTSDGKVNSDDCGFCETCGDLPEGVKSYYDEEGSVVWCELCVAAENMEIELEPGFDDKEEIRFD